MSVIKGVPDLLLAGAAAAAGYFLFAAKGGATQTPEGEAGVSAGSGFSSTADVPVEQKAKGVSTYTSPSGITTTLPPGGEKDISPVGSAGFSSFKTGTFQSYSGAAPTTVGNTGVGAWQKISGAGMKDTYTINVGKISKTLTAAQWEHFNKTEAGRRYLEKLGQKITPYSGKMSENTFDRTITTKEGSKISNKGTISSLDAPKGSTKVNNLGRTVTKQSDGTWK